MDTAADSAATIETATVILGIPAGVPVPQEVLPQLQNSARSIATWCECFSLQPIYDTSTLSLDAYLACARSWTGDLITSLNDGSCQRHAVVEARLASLDNAYHLGIQFEEALRILIDNQNWPQSASEALSIHRLRVEYTCAGVALICSDMRKWYNAGGHTVTRILCNVSASPADVYAQALIGR